MPLLQKRRRKAILLIDDDPGVRAAVAFALGECDCDLLEASSPNSAVRLWTKNKKEIALILMDVLLPGLSGPELAREMLEIDPAALITFITGVSRPYLSRFNLPTDRPVLYKPFSVRQLREAVSSALSPSA